MADVPQSVKYRSSPTLTSLLYLQRAESALWERERADFAATKNLLKDQSDTVSVNVSVNESVNMSTDLTPALSNLQLKVLPAPAIPN